MKKNSIKLITFTNTLQGLAYSRIYGKRLTVQVLNEPVVGAVIPVMILYTHSQSFKYLQGKTAELPINNHCVWSNRDGSKEFENELERVIPVHDSRHGDFTITL